MSILDVEMQPNDADAKTIREYLKKLLVAVWTEGEGFSGKRPFGNSGWQCDLELALVRADKISGKLDSEGYLVDCDSDAANDLIQAAIGALN